jgi:multiple sugar transport system ATP-binding protein
MADRIVVMKDGYIQQIGTPYELYFNPVNMFVAGFIGEPPMNFIETTIRNGRLDLKENKIDLGAVADQSVLDQYDGQKVIFGFRPEAIKVVTGGETVSKAYHVHCFTNLVELLGDNTNVYVNFDGVNSILKVDPHQSPDVGSDFEFAIPFDSVYLFDKNTEKRIKLRKE